MLHDGNHNHWESNCVVCDNVYFWTSKLKSERTVEKYNARWDLSLRSLTWQLRFNARSLFPPKRPFCPGQQWQLLASLHCEHPHHHLLRGVKAWSVAQQELYRSGKLIGISYKVKAIHDMNELFDCSKHCLKDSSFPWTNPNPLTSTQVIDNLGCDPVNWKTKPKTLIIC